MNQVTIILGKQATGKSTMARKMCSGRECVEILHCQLKYLPSKFNSDTIIFIDDVLCMSKELISLLESDKLSIRVKYKDNSIIDTPDIILVSDILKEEDFKSLKNYDSYKFINL